MLLSTEHNKLAWWLIKEYDVPRSWAMRTAYCLCTADVPADTIRFKPGSPLLTSWDPANVLKFIHLVRCQSRQASCKEQVSKLTENANKLYSRYMAFTGVGIGQVSRSMGGEAVYWASKFYVDSLAAKEKNPECKYIKVALPHGDSVTTPWFNH